MTITELHNAVRDIDREIDAIRAELLSRETVDRMCFISWGNAWAKHPELRQQERELFIRRADVLDELNAAKAKALPSFRSKPPKKCTHCHGSGLAQEAA